MYAARELRQARVARLVRHQRRALHPEGLMRVHARAVVAEDRLRHERHGLARRARDVLDDVLVDHHLVRHARQRLVAQVDLALAAGGDLVVVELARDAEPLERQHHLRAQVAQRVVRRGREVALLLAHRVAEPGLAGVPVALGRVDEVVRPVRPELVRDLVEDEELALGAEVRRVGDAAAAQVRLGLARDPARVLRVRLARERIGDLADQRERRHLGRGIEDRARRVGHEQHVALGDPLPAADRRAVEAEPFLERRLVEAVDRQRDVLPRAEQVAELQVDHRGARLLRPRERLVPGRRLRRCSASPPAPTFLRSFRLGPTKKAPRLRES